MPVWRSARRRMSAPPSGGLPAASNTAKSLPSPCILVKSMRITGGEHSSYPKALAQLPRHAAADGERRVAAAQYHEVLSIGVALDPLEMAHGNQRVAMDAHEVLRQLLLERAQRVLDQILAPQVAYGRVLL